MSALLSQGWLLAAVQRSRETAEAAERTADTLDLSKEPIDPHDPRFKFIIDGVMFTLRFMLTYHVVIVTTILLFTVIHWFPRLRRRLPVRTGATPSGSPTRGKFYLRPPGVRDDVSSSGSSTLEGSASPPTPKLQNDERTPLLIANPTPAKRPTIYRRWEAFLMYQPRPIPIVNKVLPSNETSLLVLAFIALNVFYALYRCPVRISTIFIFSDRASALFVANLPLLYFLAAKNQPIKWLTGYSYEQLNILHRRLGEMMCLLALVHFTGMIIVWYTILRPIGWSLVFFLTEKVVLLGLVAFISYELLYFTSLGSFRQRWYELFLILHVVLQLGALIIVFFHHPRGRVYVGIAIGIFTIDRLVFRLALKTRRMRADLTIMEDASTVLVSANWQLCTPNPFVPNIKQGWKTAEHVFITIPCLSRRHAFQAHPFTIASAAPKVKDTHAWLNLLIRAQCGFSKDLLEYAKAHSSANVYLDGPYGTQHALQMLRGGEVAIVVAGGSGIAVAYPLIWALSTSLQENRSNRDLDQEAAEGIPGRQKIHLVWIVREESQFSWLGPARLKELEDFGAETHLLPPTIENGRPDIPLYLQQLAVGNSQKDRERKVGVICSGPDSMNREVRNSCAAMVRHGSDVKVAIEKFGW